MEFARRAYAPRDLAERWQCSERHIRNMLNRGALRHFKLGSKLVRIPFDSVEEYEKSQSTEMSPSEADADERRMREAANGARMTVSKPRSGS